MALATLSIDLVAKLSSLEQGFDKASRLAEQNAAKIDASFSALRVGAAALGGLVAGIFAGFSLVDFIKGTNAGIDKLNDLKDATGSSINNLSALEDIAARTGNSFDSFASSLIKFNKGLQDAKPGDDVSRLIKALNLDIAELKRLDPAEALRRVAVQFAGFAEDGDRARQMQVLLGKSVRETAPFMADLASKTELTGTVSKNAAEEAEKFSHQLSSLGKDSVDTARAIVGPIVEGLNSLIAKFKETRDASRTFWAKLREEEAKADAVDQEESRLSRMDALNKLLATGNLTLERRGRLENQLRGLQNPGGSARNENFDGPAETRGRQKPPLNVPGAATLATAARQTEIERLIQRLNEQTLAEITAGDAAKNLERAQLELATNPRLATATAAQRQAYLDLADGLDKLQAKFEGANTVQQQFRLSEIRGTEATNEALRQSTLAQAEAFHQLIAATPTAQLEATRNVMRELADAFERGDINAEQFTEAAQTKLGTLPEQFAAVLSDMELLAQDAAHGINDALGETIGDVLTGRFEDIGKTWERLLLRMTTQALQAQIGKALFGDVLSSGGAAGSGGGLFGSIFSGLLGSKAGGGGVKPWSVNRVNENGAEGLTIQGKDYLMNGGSPGKITPAGGGGGAPTFVFQIAAGVSRNEVASLIPTLKAQIKGELITQMRRPGFSGA